MEHIFIADLSMTLGLLAVLNADKNEKCMHCLLYFICDEYT